MLISVITATYNSQASIKKTIESVASQGVPFEHIIVDGGSKDKTLEILEQFPHLVWKSETDKGVYDAFNKGLKMAEGDWIYFLGSDDELLPGVLSQLMKVLNEPGLDLIYGNVWVRKTQSSYNGQFSLEAFLKNNICQQAIFYKRGLFKDNYFNLNFPVFADYAFNIKLLAIKNLNVRYVPFDIALYDGDGMSERMVDKSFLKKKVKLFCQALNKKRFDSFFNSYRHQESINQILYGNIILGWVEMLVYSWRVKVFFKNLYTALAMTKERLRMSLS